MNKLTFSRIVRLLATFFLILVAILGPSTLNATALDEPIINGDFELGNTGWTFSSYNASIVSSGYDGVIPHGGTKMASITNGGFGIPDGYIEQTFTIPEDTPYLSYWWSSNLSCHPLSGGRCGGTLSVSINNSPLTSFSVQFGGTTPWQRIVLDTYSYRGSKVTIRFTSLAFLDGIHNYIDDITFTGSVPRTFSKTNPADKAANQPSNPTLSWGDSPTASEYWVCYDMTDDNDCTDWVSNGTFTVKPLNSLLADTTYYWQVKAVNSYGTTYANGDSAAFWSFKTPAIGAPALTYLLPAEVVAGSPGFTLTIVGADFTGFVDGAQVFWNGEARPTTFVSPTQLTTEISAADVATEAIAQVTVKNPDLVESNALSMIVYVPNTISGNAGAGGVTLSYTDGTPKTVMADNSGNYSFTVTYNWSGTITPTKTGYAFTPDHRSYTNVLADQTGQNYTAYAVATFADAPTSYWSWSYIERLYAAEITGGCGTAPLIYCPEATVTRAQMAVFLERGMNGSSYSPPTATGSVFGDVPTSYWSASWVEKLYADGITGGCGGGNYCPEASVTRAQMAVFLLRAKHGSSYSPPAATGDFGDVPTSYWAASWIEQLTAEGITTGCGDGNYCPEQPVSRAQMAVFLVRTFNLP